MLKVLLTGGSGFIGAHIRKEFQNYENVDLTCLNRTLINPVEDKIFDLTLDDYDSLPSSETIIHAAQTRHYNDFNERAPDVFKVNVESTFKLLEHAIKMNADQFILISTGSVYENHAGKWLETEKLCPTSANGITKHMAEQITRLYQDRIKICILRIFFPYGPNQQNQLVPRLIEAVKHRNPIELCDNNGLIFSPTFVADIARLIVKASKENWEGIFNISTPHKISLRKFCNLIGERLNVKPQYVIKNSGPISMVPDTKKLKEVCQDFSWTSLGMGVKMTITDKISTSNKKDNKKIK